MADPLEDPGYDFTLDDLINTFRPSQNYGEGMTGDQTARYDRVLELTGSKDLANIAASGDISSLLKNLGGAAKSFLTSPGGIASLGAILGTIDRPKPTGGGTTMAYPGAAQLTRKMVQGPYGPLAEYTGVGGGAPDYTRFTAPKVEFPTVAPSPAPAPGGGLSVQAKVDLYKQLRGYGLSDERVRRISETMFGPQTDSDWAELTKRAGPVASGIASGAPAAPRTAAPAATPSPAPASSQGASTYKPTGMASWLQTSLSPTEKAAAYNAYLSNNMTDAEIRSMADQTFGKQSDSDWAELKRLAGTLPKDLLPSGKSFTDLQLKNAVKGFLDSSQQAKSGVPREEASTFTGPPSLQVSQSSTPQQKAQEYQRLRQFGMSDSQIRAMVDTQMGKQTDSDWQALKSLAGETAATATARNPTGEVADQDTWNKNAAFATRATKNRQQPLAIWRDPVSGNGIAVIPNDSGVPAALMYIDSSGTGLNSTAFNAADLYRSAEKLGMDLSNIGQLGAQLDAKRVGYKPYELYKGTGSDHGIDFQDIAQGGLGTAYDWTKDPLAHLKGPTAQTNLAENQALAQRLGINKNVETTTEQGIDPTRFTTLMAGSEPRSNVAFTGGTASWYGTPQQAQNYLTKTGVSGQVYDTSSGAPKVIPAAQPAAQPPSPRDLKSLLPSDWGSITDPSKKIDWFNQQKATESELTAAGVKPEEIAWMRQNKLGTYAMGGITQGYAHGGLVHMEDGGFVLPKKAVDGAGGPRGIQQLVPGARMVRGPGTGTSDDIPAVINGPRGQTPARLSNGEAYVPKRFVQAQGGPQRMYALMNNLQRKA